MKHVKNIFQQHGNLISVNNQHNNVENGTVIKHCNTNNVSKKPTTTVPRHSNQVVLKPSKHNDGQTDITDIPHKEMRTRVPSNLVVVDLTDDNMRNKENHIIVDLTEEGDNTAISNPSKIQFVTDKPSHITEVMALSVNSLLNTSFENISAQTNNDVIALTSIKHQGPGNLTKCTMHDTVVNSQCLSKNELQVNLLIDDDLLSEKYYEDMSTPVELETTSEVDIDYILNGIDVDEIVETLKNYNVIEIIESDDEYIHEPSTVLTMSTKGKTNCSEPMEACDTLKKWDEKLDVPYSCGNINTDAENTSCFTSNSELKYNYKNALFTEINEKVLPNTNQLPLSINSMMNAESEISDTEKTCNKVSTCGFHKEKPQQNRGNTKETNSKDVHSWAVDNKKRISTQSKINLKESVAVFKKNCANNHNSVKDYSVNDKCRSERNLIKMKVNPKHTDLITPTKYFRENNKKKTSLQRKTRRTKFLLSTEQPTKVNTSDRKENTSTEQKSCTKKENKKCDPSRGDNKMALKGKNNEFNNTEQGKNMLMNKKNKNRNSSQKRAPTTTEIKQIKENSQCRFKTLDKVNNNFGAIINTKMSMKNYVIPKIKKHKIETNQDTTQSKLKLKLKSIKGQNADVDFKSSASQFITGSKISNAKGDCVATLKPKQNKCTEKREKVQNLYYKTATSSNYQIPTKQNKQPNPLCNVSFNSPIKENNILKHKIREDNGPSKSKKMCHYNTTLESKSNIGNAKLELPLEIREKRNRGVAQLQKSSVIKEDTKITPCRKQMHNKIPHFKPLVEKRGENEIVDSRHVQRRIIKSDLSLSHNERKRKPPVVIEKETIQRYKDSKQIKYKVQNKSYDKKRNRAFQNVEMSLETSRTDHISAAEKAQNKVSNNNSNFSQLIAIPESPAIEVVSTTEEVRNKATNNSSDISQLISILETPHTEDVSTKEKYQNKVNSNNSYASQVIAILETPQTEDVSTKEKAQNKVNNSDVSQLMAILETPQTENMSTKEKAQNQVNNNNSVVSELIAILETPQTEDVSTIYQAQNKVNKNNGDFSQLIAIPEIPQTEDVSTKEKAQNKVNINNSDVSQLIAILETPQTENVSPNEKAQNKVTNNNNDVSQLISIIETAQTEDDSTRKKVQSKVTNNKNAQNIYRTKYCHLKLSTENVTPVIEIADVFESATALETPSSKIYCTKTIVQNEINNNAQKEEKVHSIKHFTLKSHTENETCVKYRECITNDNTSNSAALIKYPPKIKVGFIKNIKQKTVNYSLHKEESVHPTKNNQISSRDPRLLPRSTTEKTLNTSNIKNNNVQNEEKKQSPKTLPMPDLMSKEQNKTQKIETEILTNFSEFSNPTWFRRYITNGVIHTGFHSRVIKAEDKIKNKSIAVKILLQTPISDRTQIKLLQKLTNADKNNNFHCICVEEIFVLDSRWCIAMEYYPQNLSQALQLEGAGFHIDRVQDLSRQLLAALMLLRINEIIHRDIKPAHILINAEHTKIKLTGFDNAVCAIDANSSPQIGTLNYRAPEITLGMKISYPADVWAAACTMFELATNQVLFEGSSTNLVLQNIMLLKGAFSEQLIRSSPLSRLYFQKNKLREWQPLNHLKNDEVNNMKQKSICLRLFDASKPTATSSKSQAVEERTKRVTFSELLDSLLALDSSVRKTVELAYIHPFIYK